MFLVKLYFCRVCRSWLYSTCHCCSSWRGSKDSSSIPHLHCSSVCYNMYFRMFILSTYQKAVHFHIVTTNCPLHLWITECCIAGCGCKDPVICAAWSSCSCCSFSKWRHFKRDPSAICHFRWDGHIRGMHSLLEIIHLFRWNGNCQYTRVWKKLGLIKNWNSSCVEITPDGLSTTGL